MLREEVEQYTNLTGEDGWHVPIMKVGAYLDGYNKGLEVLDKIKAEIENDWQLKKYPSSPFSCGLRRAMEIIDKYKAPDQDRDCEHCVHRKDKGCEKWDCEFERRPE